jgi:hypothetical protein
MGLVPSSQKCNGAFFGSCLRGFSRNEPSSYYSIHPYLASADFFLFHKFENAMKATSFSSVSPIQRIATRELKAVMGGSVFPLTPFVL